MKRFVKLTSFLVVFALLVSLMPGFAVQVNAASEDLTWKLASDGTLTISGSGAMGSAPWQQYSELITSVIIGEGCTSICDKAFYGLPNLSEVLLPRSLETIGQSAFEKCTSLQEIVLPQKLTAVGVWAFRNCASLNKITVKSEKLNAFNPDTFLGAGSNAEEGIEVVFEKTVKEIPENMFACNNSYVKEIFLGETVERVGVSAFYNCNNLETVEIANNSLLKSIERNAFQKCSKLTEMTIPDSVTDLSLSAFSDCISLKRFQVSQSNAIYATDSVGVLYSKDMKTLLLCPDGLSGSYTVPEGVIQIGKGLDATGDNAFFGCKKLTEVKLPISLIRIAAYAFYDCDSLSTVAIPTAVAEIGRYAFSNCDNLRQILIPGNVATVGESVFSNCDKLKTVTIESGVRKLGASAFYDCNKLSAVVLPDTLTTIEKFLFSKCDALISITIPASVKEIGEEAFFDCYRLEEIIFEGDVPKFTNSAFPVRTADNPIKGYYPLTNTTWTETARNSFSSNNRYFTWEPYLREEDSDEITGEEVLGSGTDNALHWQLTSDGTLTISGSGAIGSNPWMKYTSLIRKVLIEEGCTGICANAFANCEMLDTLILPDSLQRIDATAFENCIGLREVTIPSGVAFIDMSAFSGCTNLQKYIVSANNDTYGSDASGALFSKDMKRLIQVPCGYEETYTIAESATEIGDFAFQNCDKLQSVVVSDAVEAIGEGAFSDCDNLSKVIFGSGTKKLGNRVFYNCAGLTSIEIPNAVTQIGQEVFYNCDNLQTVSVGNGVQSLSNRMFFDCDALTSIKIPNTVTAIGQEAFYDCDSLSSITIPESITRIEQYAFSNCDNLREILIPGTVGIVAESAFSSCNKLKKATIESGVTKLGSSTFYGCSKLSAVTLPDTLTTIEKFLFSKCDSLTSIKIPASVKKIEEEAFFDCYQLEEIIFNGDVPYCADNAFPARKEDNPVIGYYPLRNVTWTEAARKSIGAGHCQFLWISYTEGLDSNGEDIFIVDQGNCGATTTWLLEVGGEITVAGDGMMQFAAARAVESNPWMAYQGIISSVVVEQGVTSIAGSAFAECDKVKEVTISSSVEVLEDFAFSGCGLLSEITFQGSAPELGKNCFEGVTATLYYPETDVTWTENVLGDCGGQITLSASEHSHEYKATITAPTCMEKGYTTYLCVCGDNYVGDEIGKLDHSWVEATCTAPKTCAICKTTEGEKLEHNWTDATCTTPKTCTVCKTTEGDALDHTPDTQWKTDDTNHWQICVKCGEEMAESKASHTGNDCQICGKKTEVPEVTFGDTNNDGSVNAKDAMLVLQFYTKKITEDKLNLTACDVDGNGTVNAKDAMLILQFYTKKIDKFPADQTTEQPEKNPAPNTTVLDLAGKNLTAIEAALGTATRAESSGSYWTQNRNVGFYFAYGEEKGCTYITGSLDQIIDYCPATLTISQLKEIFPGGYEEYDAMEDKNLFFWTYQGITVGFLGDGSGTYTAQNQFYYNCDALVANT